MTKIFVRITKGISSASKMYDKSGESCVKALYE